jgi:Na+/H+ antiporter NhaC
MVVLASILGSFLRIDLHTGSYLAQLLLGTAPVFLLPVLFFIVSLIITLMTGSAWGAFSMLIPISTQMLVSFLQLTSPVAIGQIPLLFPVLGAVLSGAACGNHLSPFAETTVMTAASTGIESMEHAKTQFWYAIPVLVGTVVSFILAGLVIDSGLLKSFLIASSAGIVVTILLLLMFAYGRKSA